MESDGEIGRTIGRAFVEPFYAFLVALIVSLLVKKSPFGQRSRRARVTPRDRRTLGSCLTGEDAVDQSCRIPEQRQHFQAPQSRVHRFC